MIEISLSKSLCKWEAIFYSVDLDNVTVIWQNFLNNIKKCVNDIILISVLNNGNPHRSSGDPCLSARVGEDIKTGPGDQGTLEDHECFSVDSSEDPNFISL